MEKEPFLTYPWTLLRSLWQAIFFVDAILIFVPGPQLLWICCVLAVVALLVIVFIPYDGLNMASPYVYNLLLSPCNLILGATILIQICH